jgi:hypothetical protein
MPRKNEIMTALENGNMPHVVTFYRKYEDKTSIIQNMNELLKNWLLKKDEIIEA